MADIQIRYFQNTDGHAKIDIPVKKFKCIGANPPHDHPHIYLDMGKNNNIVCPYCSTNYTLNTQINNNETLPPNCNVEN
jgi:uncharacterized Zn-finger protein